MSAVVARRGAHEYLVVEDPRDPSSAAYVYDASTQTTFAADPPSSMHAILARGYWVPCDTPPLDVEEKAAQRHVRTPEGARVFHAPIGSLIVAHADLGHPDGAGTLDDPIDVQGDLDLAIDLIAAGRHVRLNQPNELATLVDRLAKLVNDKRRFNLCLVSVPGTNLFCRANQRRKRIEMPQLEGTPLPGSEAAKLPRNARGYVDVSAAFRRALEASGVRVTTRSRPVDRLRSTQSELDGALVARIADELAKDRVDDPIFVTRDGYILDGHHAWAARVARDARDGHLGDVHMDVHEIDLDIGAALDYADAFTAQIGIAHVNANSPDPDAERKVVVASHEAGSGSELKDARAKALDDGVRRIVAYEDALAALLDRFYGARLREVIAAARHGEKTLQEAQRVADPAAWRARLEGDATKLVYRIAADGASDVATRLGASAPIGLESPEVQAVVRDVVRRMMRTTEARAEAVRAAIFTPGADVEAVVRDLIGLREQREIWSAEEARTAVTSAVNGGAYIAARRAGATTKEWLSSRDDRVRRTHTREGGGDGQRVDIDGRFRIGAALLLYPGDPAGPPGEVINCRCVLLYR